ncbi:MAG: Periplasmic copper-binding protein [Anaerolineaceae bacterium]|nr:MAG: Periplasmic copper-binding protein [Anaerolineaceae bacterium]
MFTKNSHRAAVIFVIVFLLAAGCGAGTPTAASVPTTASLSEVQGQVDILNPGEGDYSPAADGMTLQVEGQVATGDDGRLRLDLSSGTVIRLASGTIFTLVSNDPQPEGLLTRIKLEAGRMWIALNGGSMDVETPAGLASVRGSNMMVWVDPVFLNVYVYCFEGNCGAENPSGSVGMSTGGGALLYHFETGGNPPPPVTYTLSWQHFQEWVDNNPEAGNIMPSIAQTLTAIPQFTPTFTSTPTETPTATPTATATPSCFTLLSPADGASLPGLGEVTFSWSAQPGAAGYRLTIVSPRGAVNSFATTATSSTRYIENFQLGGVYTWSVAALDAAGAPLCIAGPFTFVKDESPTPSIPFGSGNATFLSELGPTATLSQCGNEYFAVTVVDPNGVQNATVRYQVVGGTSGSFPLSPTSTSQWSAWYSTSDFYGQAVQWWFVVVDGAGNLETSGNIFSFTCGN